MGYSILYSKKSRASTAQSPKFSIKKNCFLVVFNKDKKLLQNPLQNPTRCAIILTVLRSTANSRPVGQAVKTLASHAEIMGSIPVRVTNQRSIAIAVLFCFFKKQSHQSSLPAPPSAARGTGIRPLFEKSGAKTLQKGTSICPRAEVIENIGRFSTSGRKSSRKRTRHDIVPPYGIGIRPPIFKVSQGGAGEAFSKADPAYFHPPATPSAAGVRPLF